MYSNWFIKYVTIIRNSLAYLTEMFTTIASIVDYIRVIECMYVGQIIQNINLYII